MGVSLYAVALPTGSLMMTEMVYRQFEPLWGVIPWLQNWFILTPYGFVAGIIFLITMVAETNRAPFDLPEAESELIAGYHTEYSSMKFAVFFMGEYAVMLAFSGVFATVFLGGWSPLPLNWEYLSQRAGEMGWTGVAGLLQVVMHPAIAPLWFLGKVFLGITFYIWLRATYPRLRYDQLMALGWKFLLPAAAVNFVIAATTMLYGWKVALGCWLGVGVGYALIYWGYLRERSMKYPRGVQLVDLRVSEESSRLSGDGT
jgi:NADH-quinone oxidoreductase subunit H